ncbi:MAG: DUF1846 domain-containing protein [Nanoarchaeota archaeon]|nr:DUF1846 domain-containing protein [Nanoarchaeota archaeon]
MEKGFDTEKYLEIQSSEILKRVNNFDKLYLEFGGKICDDFHAARVLPGYDANAKIKMLEMIKDDSEIVFCISAKDIENGKMRADFGLNYEAVTLKSINDLRNFGLDVSAVVINRFSGEKKALKFKRYLENIGIRVYLQNEIEGYPADVDKIVSEEGYGKNPYVNTKKSIVVVTGAGPGSGKMSFCLSQLYHDNVRGMKSGFSKFETFPIWDLEIDHPVNIAYEAATADIGDVNMIDPFHLQANGVAAVNYNRDIENFPILKSILKKIGMDIYASPTEMGVSKAKQGIIDDEVVREASKQEIIRRYFRYKKENLLGIVDKGVVDKVEKLMQELEINEDYRSVVGAARQSAMDAVAKEGKGNKGFCCGSAIQIGEEIICGKNSELLHSESSCIINALKHVSNIPDDIALLSESLIKSIQGLKEKIIKNSSPSLDVSEVLISLAISSSTNPTAKKCIDNLPLLHNCEMHTTHLLTRGDENGLRDLGINLTTDAEFTPKIYFRS